MEDTTLLFEVAWRVAKNFWPLLVIVVAAVAHAIYVDVRNG